MVWGKIGLSNSTAKVISHIGVLLRTEWTFGSNHCRLEAVE